MKNIKLWTVTWILVQNWAYWQRVQQTDCRLSCWPLWGTLTRLGKQSRYSATCVSAWTSSQTALPILSWASWCCSRGPSSLRSPWLLECEYSPALWIPFFFFFIFADLMKILYLCLIQDSLRYSSLLLFCAFVRQSVITVFPPHPSLLLLEDYVICEVPGAM